MCPRPRLPRRLRGRSHPHRGSRLPHRDSKTRLCTHRRRPRIQPRGQRELQPGFPRHPAALITTLLQTSLHHHLLPAADLRPLTSFLRPRPPCWAVAHPRPTSLPHLLPLLHTEAHPRPTSLHRRRLASGRCRIRQQVDSLLRAACRRHLLLRRLSTRPHPPPTHRSCRRHRPRVLSTHLRRLRKPRRRYSGSRAIRVCLWLLGLPHPSQIQRLASRRRRRRPHARIHRHLLLPLYPRRLRPRHRVRLHPSLLRPPHQGQSRALQCHPQAHPRHRLRWQGRLKPLLTSIISSSLQQQHHMPPHLHPRPVPPRHPRHRAQCRALPHRHPLRPSPISPVVRQNLHQQSPQQGPRSLQSLRRLHLLQSLCKTPLLCPEGPDSCSPLWPLSRPQVHPARRCRNHRRRYNRV